MSEQQAIRKYALECLRLKADCVQLAGEVATPELQRHFLDQAEVWGEMAERGLVAKVQVVPQLGPDSSD